MTNGSVWVGKAEKHMHTQKRKKQMQNNAICDKTMSMNMRWLCSYSIKNNKVISGNLINHYWCMLIVLHILWRKTEIFITTIYDKEYNNSIKLAMNLKLWMMRSRLNPFISKPSLCHISLFYWWIMYSEVWWIMMPAGGYSKSLIHHLLFWQLWHL